MFKLNEVYNCDCLEGLQKMSDKFVDVSFTSPPYNDKGRKCDYDEHGILMNGQKNTHTKYKYIEFRRDWFEWQCNVIDELLRVSKKYVLYNVQGLVNNRKDIYKLIGRYSDRIHDIVIWHKPNGTPTGTPHKMSNRYEFLLILKCDGIKGVTVNSKFYTNVIMLNSNKNREYSKIHKAIMSKPFCDEIIREFTQEGDIVLDPFFGLGTTGMSCVEQNRHYIGFELFEEYCEIAKKRIAEATYQIPITS